KRGLNPSAAQDEARLEANPRGLTSPASRRDYHVRMCKHCATARYLSSGPSASASPRHFGAATMGSMALIVFFRGINVGGHRAFRPSVLAKELAIYDAVNVGAAGTLVVRKPGVRAKFLAELRRKLPFEATIAFCDGRDLLRLEIDN